MFAIFDKRSGVEVWGGVHLRTARQAWKEFKSRHDATQKHRLSGTVVPPDGPKGADMLQTEFYECRMVGARAPALRAPGHHMTKRSNALGGGSSHVGKCSCGWTCQGVSRRAIREAFVVHLQEVAAPERIPAVAARLSASQRVANSVGKLKAEGGERKTFRLPKPAIEELSRMVTEELYPNQTAAIEALLAQRATPRIRASSSLYPTAVEDPQVVDAIELAVQSACRELDRLFPGAEPDGGKGICSNFQGLLVDHVKAMLCGHQHAQRSHEARLPVLLADDKVFGVTFALPPEPGAGYMVLNLSDSAVLDAYSGRFVHAYGTRERQKGMHGLVALFGEQGSVLQPWFAPSDYVGAFVLFPAGSEPDILFSSFEAAREAALRALSRAGSAPAETALRIVAGQYDDQIQGFALV